MKRFSILTNDLERCIECGCNNINLHEVYYGTGKRKLSIKYGFVIPLCQNFHHNQFEMKGIHFDKKLNLKYKKLMQLKAMEVYNWSKEDFIKIIGKNYL